MPSFQTFTIIKWLHVTCMAMGGGAAMVVLFLVGFEESREDLHGLTALLWKRTAAWGFRLAFLFGLALLGMRFAAHSNPFYANYLHLKLVLVLLLLATSEMAPKALASHKRGAPLLAFVLFLLTSFVSVNGAAFGYRLPDKPAGPAGALQQAR